MYTLNSMNVVVKKDEVLGTLRKNRELHSKIVREAREGYCKKATVELGKRMEKLKEGRITSLAFSLRMPVDQTSVYDTAIKMLEMHTGETITMSGGEVRNLIEDKWDWTNEFYASNRIYSGTAQAQVQTGSDEEDSE
jgi:hypothetical protein